MLRLVIFPAPEHRLIKTRGLHNLKPEVFYNSLFDVNDNITVAFNPGDMVDVYFDVFFHYSLSLPRMRILDSSTIHRCSFSGSLSIRDRMRLKTPMICVLDWLPTLKTIIPENSCGGYALMSEKSVSKVIGIRLSLLHTSIRTGSFTPCNCCSFTVFVSCPSLTSSSATSTGRFSSILNCINIYAVTDTNLSRDSSAA